MKTHVLWVAGLLFLASPGALGFDSITDVEVAGTFIESEDLSGIACADPMGTWPRHCLVVVDEGLAVQRATLTENAGGYEIEPGDTLELFGYHDKAVNPPFVGTPPQTACSEGVKDAKELDAEAVTFADGFYFVAGSHGCGRNNHAARLSAFLVARLAADAESEAPPTTEISFWLNEILATLPELAGHFGTDLDAGGISIEGLAALGDPARLYFGLRSPTDGSRSYILSVDAAALFKDGADLAASLQTVDLSVAGSGVGIRDLAIVDDIADRLLILIGPSTGEGGTYTVADYDLSEAELGPPSTLHTPPGGKAEGALLVDRLDTKAKVLFLHDGLADGAATMEIVALH